jgi:D-alanine-D-alanine ligase
MNSLSVAVIGGGRNGEHDVSLDSAAAIVAALDPARYVVTPFTIDRDGGWLDAAGSAIGIGRVMELLAGVDVVFPTVHGRHGEDGTLAGLCELIGVPYVGSGVTAGAIGMNKHATKLVARAAGIQTSDAVLLDAESAGRYRFSHPVVVKPNSAGSSVGVSLVTEPERLRDAVDAALAADSMLLVEEVMVGREIDIAVMRRGDGSLVISPPLEIVADAIFDNDTKYGGAAVFRVPAQIDGGVRGELESAAVRVYEALGCRGVARIDFFITAAGPVLNEVNTTPGFTARSQVPRMFAAAGIDYPELLDMLIADALTDRPSDRPSARTARILHPAGE